MLSLTFEKIHNPEHYYFDKAFELYQKSFPIFEQRLRNDQVDVLSDDKYHFNLVMYEKEFLGILLTWQVEDFIYIEHLAIISEKRGQNIGTRVLECLKSGSDKPIILEIDPPRDPISIKRKIFYEKVGFIESDLTHKHPPYQLGWEAHTLKIMSYPSISDRTYDSFKYYLDNHIMKYAEIRK